MPKGPIAVLHGSITCSCHIQCLNLSAVLYLATFKISSRRPSFLRRRQKEQTPLCDFSSWRREEEITLTDRPSAKEVASGRGLGALLQQSKHPGRPSSSLMLPVCSQSHPGGEESFQRTHTHTHTHLLAQEQTDNRRRVVSQLELEHSHSLHHCSSFPSPPSPQLDLFLWRLLLTSCNPSSSFLLPISAPFCHFTLPVFQAAGHVSLPDLLLPLHLNLSLL